jgi:cation transport ATPase
VAAARHADGPRAQPARHRGLPALAQARADAVFLGLQLAPMLDAVTTARKARSLMRQNLILAMIYNMFATRIGVIALVTPLIAAILSDDDFSELQ